MLKDLKAIILAGGLGTRLAEETDQIPKPMVRVGEYPILLHIMSIYATFGIQEFIVCGGYRVNVIQEYFSSNDGQRILKKNYWKLNIVDTGVETGTAHRISALQDLVEDNFLMTYGDGLTDLNIENVVTKHLNSKLIATVTAVHPPARFGTLEIENEIVSSFEEKDKTKSGWINGGFFVLRREIFDYIERDDYSFEGSPMRRLVLDRQLGAYKHDGFWHPMDTLREKRDLERYWNSGQRPWPGSEFLESGK